MALKIVDKNKDTVKHNNAKKRASELLSQMTLAEKVGQLNQRLYGFSIYERNKDEITLSKGFKEEVKKFGGLGVLYGLYRADPWSKKDFDTGLDKELAPKVYNMVQAYVLEHSRLKIPMLLSTECPHGHQALDGYLLPVNLACGATFNKDLLHKAYRVCGKQLKQMGVDMALVSTLDVLRDPRWGRSEECFSEDPYLSKELAKAVVTGIQDEGVVAVAKHFCAQGEGTGGINASAARIGERELREIHLPSTKACCEVGVGGIMAAYNEIDGIPCHSNRRLLKDILRDEFLFDGLVMSDGVAIDQLNVITGDVVKSGAMALSAGIDISLWDTAFSKLEEAYERGLVTMEDIDEAVLKVLTLKYERGLFDNPFIEETSSWSDIDYSIYDESLTIARESVVLLKNDENFLPIKLKHNKKIAVIGPSGDEIYNQLGDYTPPIREEEGVTLLKGIRNYIYENNSNVEVVYEQGCSTFYGSKESIKKAAKLAKESDVVILVLGGSSSRFQGASFDINGAVMKDSSVQMDCGEGVDTATLALPAIQEELAKEIYKTKKDIVTIVMGGRPYVINKYLDSSKALLYSFYPGIKGGTALAEILFGKISPSGCLSVSIPRHVGQLPVYYNPKASYRAYNYYELDNSPMFSFGYGLSYTTFNPNSPLILYGNSKDVVKEGKVSMERFLEEGLLLKLNVENIGEYDAFCVIQLFIRDKVASVVPRIKELKAFDKVFIKSNTSVTCTLKLTKEELSLWNNEMKFIVEAGEFELIISCFGKEYMKELINLEF